jgi:hypothetical protein
VDRERSVFGPACPIPKVSSNQSEISALEGEGREDVYRFGILDAF